MCYDFLRSVPYLALIGIVAEVAGLLLVLRSKEEVDGAFEVLTISEAKLAFEFLPCIILATVGIDLIAVLQAVFVSGKLREVCCGMTETCVAGCCQCLCGRFLPGITVLLLVCAFLVQFMWACLLINGMTIIFLVKAACANGEGTVNGLVSALALMYRSRGNQVATALLSDASKLCNEPIILHGGIGGVCVGTVACMLAQVWLLVITYGNVVRAFQDPVATHGKKLKSAGYGSTV